MVRTYVAAAMTVVASVLVACGGGGNSTEDQIDRWAQQLATGVLEESPAICSAIDTPDNVWLASDSELMDQIPDQHLEAVSERMIVKLQEMCRER